MEQQLIDLLKQKESLQEQIKIQEIGNDSYYLSPLYRAQKSELYQLNKLINQLQTSQKADE